MNPRVLINDYAVRRLTNSFSGRYGFEREGLVIELAIVKQQAGTPSEFIHK
jgi:hypothetical protein